MAAEPIVQREGEMKIFLTNYTNYQYLDVLKTTIDYLPPSSPPPPWDLFVPAGRIPPFKTFVKTNFLMGTCLITGIEGQVPEIVHKEKQYVLKSHLGLGSGTPTFTTYLEITGVENGATFRPGWGIYNYAKKQFDIVRSRDQISSNKWGMNFVSRSFVSEVQIMFEYVPPTIYYSTTKKTSRLIFSINGVSRPWIDPLPKPTLGGKAEEEPQGDAEPDMTAASFEIMGSTHEYDVMEG